MQLHLRYVTKRPRKSGPPRLVWQRPGYKALRLDDNPAIAAGQAELLNRRADEEQAKERQARDYINPAAIRGTVAWIIAKYKEHPRYKDRAPGTRRCYDVWLRRVEERWARLPIAGIDRAAVVDLIDAIPTKGGKRGCANVLARLFDRARYYGLVGVSPADKLGIEKHKGRDVFWSRENINAYLEKAGSHPAAIQVVRHFKLMLYTGQRPGDCLAMTRGQFNGERIKVRQEKTRVLVDIWCHTALKAELASNKDSLLLVPPIGKRRFSYKMAWLRFSAIKKEAGLDRLNMQDLRRTAVVYMAEAGCTVPEIVSVTGHSLENAEKILKTYFVRTGEMSRAAIEKVERREADLLTKR